MVRARDAAGNISGASNTVTRNGSHGAASNLAVGQADHRLLGGPHLRRGQRQRQLDVTTYWEGAGGSYPNTLTVKLGANADTESVVVKLNPDSGWGARTQNIQVLGREQNATGVHQPGRRQGLRVQPGHGQHGDHPGHRPAWPTSS